jgi:hypothetical protein
MRAAGVVHFDTHLDNVVTTGDRLGSCPTSTSPPDAGYGLATLNSSYSTIMPITTLPIAQPNSPV